MTTQTTVQFRVIYDGPALDTHEMNVKDLAPALLAIGELLEEANTILNQDRTKVAVNIKAPPTSGSIGIDFSVVQDLLKHTISLFSGDEVTAAINIINVLGINNLNVRGIGGGLIQFIKWLANRKVRNVIKLEHGNLRIEVEGGESIEEKEEVIKLFQSYRIRKSLESIVYQPLQTEGINSITFKYGNNIEKIERIESDFYVTPQLEEQEVIGEGDIETNLQIVSISFHEGNKWKFSDGSVIFFADILDQEFVKRVQQNQESFSKDDILKVLLYRRQYLTVAGMKTDYSIKKVISHRSASIQIRLPFSEDPAQENDVS